MIYPREKPLQILELFGGVGAPRAALRNIGVPVKSIDYVEIDEKAVRTYNEMFSADAGFKPQDVRDFNLKPHILIHGSPCQDISIAGKRLGADEGSNTRSSLMWETLRIIRSLGEWRPEVVIWENVKNVISKSMRHNFNDYIYAMDKLGYVSKYACLDARDFGIPQARQRVFVVSVLGNNKFSFDSLRRVPMAPVYDFLQSDSEVDAKYTIVSKSMTSKIFPENYDNNKLKMLSIIKNYAMTITTKQDRCPNSGIIKRTDGSYRLLTELECWRLQGFSDDDFLAALRANPSKPGKKNLALYKQAGNSICVPVLESIFESLLNYVI